MTTASSAGTPLILSVLALGIAFLSTVGSIAAVLMARANLHRQIQVASREAWMREFREQVAVFFSAFASMRNHVAMTPPAPEKDKRLVELRDVWSPASHIIRLLIAEKGTQYAAFVPKMDGIPAELTVEAEARMREFYEAAENILRSERAAIEALLRFGAVRWRPWSQFVAWSRRDPPRFRDLP
jgi:hypothetical protein